MVQGCKSINNAFDRLVAYGENDRNQRLKADALQRDLITKDLQDTALQGRIDQQSNINNAFGDMRAAQLENLLGKNRGQKFDNDNAGIVLKDKLATTASGRASQQVSREGQKIINSYLPQQQQSILTARNVGTEGQVIVNKQAPLKFEDLLKTSANSRNNNNRRSSNAEQSTANSLMLGRTRNNIAQQNATTTAARQRTYAQATATQRTQAKLKADKSSRLEKALLNAKGDPYKTKAAIMKNGKTSDIISLLKTKGTSASKKGGKQENNQLVKSIKDELYFNDEKRNLDNALAKWRASGKTEAQITKGLTKGFDEGNIYDSFDPNVDLPEDTNNPLSTLTAEELYNNAYRK
jgi:hypothetical protein